MADVNPVAKTKAAQAADQDASEKALFAKYLSTASALIADPNGSSRVRLGHTLAELGARQNNIAFAGTYAEAAAVIESRKPSIILCEFTLDGHSGLDLLQEQRALRPENKNSIFALITANTSQSAVAAAAEEDVDTFIIKPYTLETLKRTLTKAALAKLYPSEYVKAIEAGKVHLFKGEIEPALQLFEAAMKLDSKPALACFYKAQVEMLRAALDTASNDFKSGLVHNKIHYKCLVGLFDLMMQRQQHKEAYSVVKRIAQYFPANPKRLASVLRLAIMTESYEDIESYYRIFTMLETRNDELVKYICSALIVTGKYYLMNSYNSRGLELLDKAAVSSAGKPTFLRYVIEAMVEYDKIEPAKLVLKRFPPGLQGGPDYCSMDLLIANASLEPGVVIQKGRDLLKQGIETPLIYEILIAALAKAALGSAGADLVIAASKKWPERATKFQKMAETPPVERALEPGKAPAQV